MIVLSLLITLLSLLLILLNITLFVERNSCKDQGLITASLHDRLDVMGGHNKWGGQQMGGGGYNQASGAAPESCSHRTTSWL